jgi:hypothetical protein
MANEVAWQLKIIKRLREFEGEGHKWATPYTVGVPDLVVSTVPNGLMLWEVKIEKAWNTNTDRTIALTEKQTLCLNKYKKSGASVFVCVVLDNGVNNQWLNLFAPPPDQRKLVLSKCTVLADSYKWSGKESLVDFVRTRAFNIGLQQS